MSKEKDKEIRELKKQIIDYMEHDAQGPVEVNEISQSLNKTGSGAFKKLVKAIAELEREDRIVLMKSGKFKLKESANLLEGKFFGSDRGFGFVAVEDYEKDLFIPPNETNTALHGDMVRVELTKEADPRNDKGPEGRVVEVVERGSQYIYGEFTPYDDNEVKETGFYGYVTPKDKKLPDALIQIEAKGLRPVAGTIVQVEITDYSGIESGNDFVGIINRTIGHKDEPGIEILTIVHKYNIPSEFPEEVVRESENVPDFISEEDTKGRKDLRDEVVLTIDGEDAKDLDDAIQVKKLDNGNFYLGVHIADVSHYVTENSAMDQEAYERGTSVYLTDRVIPMLPQRLSNGICSLHPNVDRLTLSCEMEIDSSGKVVDYSISPSIIRSKYRMTYEAVNKILMEDDEETKAEYSEIVDMFKQMEELHNILEKKRVQRGSIDFDTREAKIEVDPEGMPVDIFVRERGVGERMIESFMLSANETVSEHYTNQDLPILYRIHEQPDEGKMQRFLEFVTSFGITVKGTKDNISPKTLQAVINEVKGEPEEAVISMLLLRSMQQAKYDVTPVGHYGLAAEHYSHFTSPIRRYPDLVLHRLIHYYNEVDRSSKAKNKWNERLPEIAEQSSVTERRAVDAERETDEMKKAEYMQTKIGETFEGVIVSVTNFGMFIQLPNSVEGLVHISNMTDDYYEFNDRSMLMIGTRTGKVYRIGQSVEVRVTSANTETYDIDFELVEDETAPTDKPQKGKSSKKKGNRNRGKKQSDAPFKKDKGKRKTKKRRKR
ncbi:ribonuclease R [Alkalibacterium iburiense]|uniref:Ribonuclease R n=1 Tax=Alkalibacterium iburiense TaxID=290589 RepID=A0ABN0X351_9LACT